MIKKFSYNAGQKDLRLFVGILFTVENHEYFVSLSRPKAKRKVLKNTLDSKSKKW